MRRALAIAATVVVVLMGCVVGAVLYVLGMSVEAERMEKERDDD